MTDLFGIKTGTLRVCASLLAEVLEVRFRLAEGGAADGWYIARSKDRSEILALFPNRTDDDELLQPHAPDYELLLFISATRRPAEIARKLASETSFRFLESGDRLRTMVTDVLTSDDPRNAQSG